MSEKNIKNLSEIGVFLLVFLVTLFFNHFLFEWAVAEENVFILMIWKGVSIFLALQILVIGFAILSSIWEGIKYLFSKH